MRIILKHIVNPDKIKYINYIPKPVAWKNSFDNKKRPYNIGLIGWNDTVDRPDIAINYLINLKKYNSNFKLYLINNNNTNVKYVLNEKKTEYFIQLFKSISYNNVEVLDNITIEVFYERMGWIMITSDTNLSFNIITTSLSYGCVPIIKSKYAEKININDIYDKQLWGNDILDHFNSSTDKSLFTSRWENKSITCKQYIENEEKMTK